MVGIRRDDSLEVINFWCWSGVGCGCTITFPLPLTQCRSGFVRCILIQQGVPPCFSPNYAAVVSDTMQEHWWSLSTSCFKIISNSVPNIFWRFACIPWGLVEFFWNFISRKKLDLKVAGNLGGLLLLVCMSWTIIGQPGNSVFICRVQPGCIFVEHTLRRRWEMTHALRMLV